MAEAEKLLVPIEPFGDSVMEPPVAVSCTLDVPVITPGMFIVGALRFTVAAVTPNTVRSAPLYLQREGPARRR